MEPIRLNHNYTKVKGAVLLVMIAIGGALGNMLIFAEDYFDLQKGIICAVMFIVLVFLYVHLEHIDPEVEKIKERFGPDLRDEITPPGPGPRIDPIEDEDDLKQT